VSASAAHALTRCEPRHAVISELHVGESLATRDAACADTLTSPAEIRNCTGVSRHARAVCERGSSSFRRTTSCLSRSGQGSREAADGVGRRTGLCGESEGGLHKRVSASDKETGECQRSWRERSTRLRPSERTRAAGPLRLPGTTIQENESTSGFGPGAELAENSKSRAATVSSRT